MKKQLKLLSLWLSFNVYEQEHQENKSTNKKKWDQISNEDIYNLLTKMRRELSVVGLMSILLISQCQQCKVLMENSKKLDSIEEKIEEN